MKIEQLAAQAGFSVWEGVVWWDGYGMTAELRAFADLVLEEAARTAERCAINHYLTGAAQLQCADHRAETARAIRALKESK